MNLVYEENSFLSVHAEVLLCFLDNGFHVFFACYGGVDLGKFCACGVGNDFGECCFSCSGWSVEDDGGQFICFDSSVE